MRPFENIIPAAQLLFRTFPTTVFNFSDAITNEMHNRHLMRGNECHKIQVLKFKTTASTHARTHTIDLYIHTQYIYKHHIYIYIVYIYIYTNTQYTHTRARALYIYIYTGWAKSNTILYTVYLLLGHLVYIYTCTRAHTHTHKTQ